MKSWKYPLDCIVRINDNAKDDMEDSVGKYGYVLSLLETPMYDYEVKYEGGLQGRFKEKELDYFFKIGDTMRVIRTGEYGTVVTYDWQYKQVELNIDGTESLFYYHEVELAGVSLVDINTNAELHKKVLDEKHDIFVRKNSDYGNSFSEQYQEYGLLSAVIRLDDKLRRLKQLLKNEAQVKDESIRDTLLDLSNYADMTVMELDKGAN